MVLDRLLGPSQSEYDELEEDYQREKTSRRRNARSRKQLVTGLDALTGEIPNIEPKDGVVETLDEPRLAHKYTKRAIVTLLLPEGTTVVHPLDRVSTNMIGDKKLRSDQAVVVRMEPKTGGGEHTGGDENYHRTKGKTEYEVGKTVTPHGGWGMDTLDESVDVECSGGIHFYSKRRTARRSAR